MGSIVIAKCSCGLEDEILIGGGMYSFQHTAFFPYYCERCDHVIQENALDLPASCPDCDSDGLLIYMSSCLTAGDGDRTIESWNIGDKNGPAIAKGRLELDNGHYLCPRCKTMSLTFQFGGCFD